MSHRDIDMAVVEIPTFPPTSLPVSRALVITGRGIVVNLTLPDGIDVAIDDRIKIDGVPYRISGIECTRSGKNVSRNVGLVVIPLPVTAEAETARKPKNVPELDWHPFDEWHGGVRYVATTPLHQMLDGYKVYRWNDHWRVSGLRNGEVGVTDTEAGAKQIAQKDYADRLRLQAWENYMLTHDAPPLEKP